MVLLFTHQNSQRVHYIFDEVIGARLGETFQITNDWSFFKASNNEIKIAYTDIQPLDSELTDCIWIYCEGILQENFIRDWSMPVTQKLIEFHHQPEADTLFSLPFCQFEALFISPILINKTQLSPSNAVFSKKSIPFDAFSEIFWCLSRYEEYQWENEINNPSASFNNNPGDSNEMDAQQLYSPDSHGRYPAKQSLLFQNGWLDTPIVDKLIWLLGYCIDKKPLDQFEIIATADIDMALRFGGRSFFVKTGSVIQDILFRPTLLIDRVKAMLSKKDPYQMEIATLPILTNTGNFKVFVLNHRQRTDKNKQILSEVLALELKRSKEIFGSATENWGMHPSWQNESNIMATQEEWLWEKTELENNLEIPVKHSRLHYIHLRLPNSYKILQQIGIANDWSMGYPEATGFRAGTSKPYVWYNLIDEKSMGLIIHPFCIMDVTCKNYLNLSDTLSIEKGRSIKQQLAVMGGTFCFIFHNESVSNSFPWKNWKNTIINWSEKPISQTNL